jgi:hypothetical protein
MDIVPASDGMDSETACFLRGVMLPTINAARDWADLNRSLQTKGFAIAFRDGQLVFKRLETDEEICSGRFLGAPLRDLVRKLGRPSVRAHIDGHTGSLRI